MVEPADVARGDEEEEEDEEEEIAKELANEEAGLGLVDEDVGFPAASLVWNKTCMAKASRLVNISPHT